MTITVKVNGSTITGITWTRMSPLVSNAKYKQHEIDGANYDIYHVTGRNSATCTLEGVYARSSTLNAKMKTFPGSVFGVTHPIDGTIDDLLCLSCTPSVSPGGLFVTISLTLVEQ